MELTLLKFPTVTYGLYAHEEETIYLCYENLTQERKDVHPDVLGEAVLAHEFAHCLHFHQITQRHRSAQTNETKVHKEGLFETVAEYLQHVYVSDQLNQRQGIRDWMEHHMTAGPFPGWGYAGGGILSRYSDSHCYFQKIYETSLSDWRGAFSLINALAVFSQ